MTRNQAHELIADLRTNRSWLSVDRERWEAHWIDDGPDEWLVFYCPECAEREFGGD
jgi:hypothetical protein